MFLEGKVIRDPPFISDMGHPEVSPYSEFQEITAPRSPAPLLLFMLGIGDSR